MPKKKATTLLPTEHITQSILILRGQRVLLDRHLAAIYGVTTGQTQYHALPRGLLCSS